MSHDGGQTALLTRMRTYFGGGNTLAQPIETTGDIDCRKLVEECLEAVRRTGARVCQMGQTNRANQRATPRLLATHCLLYCPSPTLSEDYTRPARMLDISLGGIGLRCFESLTEGMLIHVRLPLLDGKTAWVAGRVIYCMPSEEHYRAGIAFILEQD